MTPHLQQWRTHAERTRLDQRRQNKDTAAGVETQVDDDVEMTPSQPLRENDRHYTGIAQTKLTRIAQTKLDMSLMAAVCVMLLQHAGITRACSWRHIGLRSAHCASICCCRSVWHSFIQNEKMVSCMRMVATQHVQSRAE